jgi:hypothetical protein
VTDDFFEKIYLSLASSLVSGVLGYYIRVYQDRKQTREKDLKERISKIETRIAEVSAKGLTYWALPGDDKDIPKIAAEIKSARPALVEEIRRIEKYTVKFDAPWNPHLISLHQALTDGSFEQIGRPPEPGRYQRISQAGQALIMALSPDYSSGRVAAMILAA